MIKDDSFYTLETIGGLCLFMSAIAAILISNSPWDVYYSNFLKEMVIVGSSHYSIKKPLLLWINDGLMAVYFLLIGLEIKREMKRGILQDRSSLFVPAITALCGLIVPSLIFILFNYHHPEYLKGWAIPSATDIAFTLGIISLLSSKVPFSLRVLLTAIAIFDDIAAIVIIALFYTTKLSLGLLVVAAALVILLLILNRSNVKRPSFYIVIGIALWALVLKSGVHATLAGIIIAMTIPDREDNPMLEKMEHGIHPWVTFFILPAFAFANAGVRFIGMDSSMLLHPIVLGIGLGLLLGKQIGIFLPLAYFVKFKNYMQKESIRLGHIYGLALICGVGFTMSLFIGSLAYQHQSLNLMPIVKIGVLAGSILSGFMGFVMLWQQSRKRSPSAIHNSSNQS